MPVDPGNILEYFFKIDKRSGIITINTDFGSYYGFDGRNWTDNKNNRIFFNQGDLTRLRNYDTFKSSVTVVDTGDDDEVVLSFSGNGDIIIVAFKDYTNHPASYDISFKVYSNETSLSFIGEVLVDTNVGDTRPLSLFNGRDGRIYLICTNNKVYSFYPDGSGSIYSVTLEPNTSTVLNMCCDFTINKPQLFCLMTGYTGNGNDNLTICKITESGAALTATYYDIGELSGYRAVDSLYNEAEDCIYALIRTIDESANNAWIYKIPVSTWNDEATYTKYDLYTNNNLRYVTQICQNSLSKYVYFFEHEEADTDHWQMLRIDLDLTEVQYLELVSSNSWKFGDGTGNVYIFSCPYPSNSCTPGQNRFLGYEAS